MKRALRFLLLAAVVAATGGGIWRLEHRPPEPGWQGYVDADFVRVGPTLAGLLVRLDVARGDTVTAGQTLFAQDDADDAASRDQAKAQLAEAQARLTNLETAGRDTEIAQARADLVDMRAVRDRLARDLDRDKILIRAAAVSQQALDQTQTDYNSAVAHVAAAEAKLGQITSPTGRQYEIAAQQAVLDEQRAALAQAKWRFDQRHVTAPVGGRVADTYARPGEMLAAGAPVVELLPPENILVRFFVPETEVASLHVGDRLAIGCDACGGGLTAAVSFISPQAEYTPPVIYSESARAKLVFLIEARPSPEQATLLAPGLPVSVRRLP